MADTTAPLGTSGLYPLVYEPSKLALRVNTPVLNTVTQLDDMLGKGVATRTFSQRALITAAAVAENADLTSTTYTKASTATLTPAEAGAQVVLTYRAMDTDARLEEDAGTELGAAVGTKVDADICSLFGGFTGGTVGSAAANTTFGNIAAGAAILRQAGVYSELWATIHPYQWFGMANSISLEQSMKNTPEVVREELARQWYMGSVFGVHIMVDGNIPVTGTGAATNVTGAIYPAEALVFDVRRKFDIEPFKSPKGRKVEFNASIDYAVGIAYPARGVQLKGLAPTPS